MIFVALLLLLGVSAVIYTTASSTSVSIANRQAESTAKTLAQVKEALIGWSASRTPPTDGANARPGELPCPDINPLDGYEDGSCVAGAIGRVPWKTLGIPEPKDGAGETLWYAIAGPFRIWGMNFTVINSDTKGNLTVYQDSTASAITTEAVAVIFAPGAAVDTQDRSTTDTMACTAPSGTYARNLCASNYLETAGSTNNATINGPFIQARTSSAFNDRLLVLTTAELMPPVEMRVAREVRTLLENYKLATACHSKCKGSSGCYPWADVSDGNSDAPPYEVAGVGLNRGRVPVIGASPFNWGASVCAGPPVPTVPAWFLNNNWSWVIYYSAGKAYLESGGSGCSSCVGFMLTVNGVMDKAVVILMPGPANASRPPAVPGDDPIFWQFYFEDSQNNDHKTDTTGNDLYITPTSTAYARDRIFTIP